MVVTSAHHTQTHLHSLSPRSCAQETNQYNMLPTLQHASGCLSANLSIGKESFSHVFNSCSLPDHVYALPGRAVAVLTCATVGMAVVGSGEGTGTTERRRLLRSDHPCKIVISHLKKNGRVERDENYLRDMDQYRDTVAAYTGEGEGEGQ